MNTKLHCPRGIHRPLVSYRNVIFASRRCLLNNKVIITQKSLGKKGGSVLVAYRLACWVRPSIKLTLSRSFNGGAGIVACPLVSDEVTIPPIQLISPARSFGTICCLPPIIAARQLVSLSVHRSTAKVAANKMIGISGRPVPAPRLVSCHNRS